MAYRVARRRRISGWTRGWLGATTVLALAIGAIAIAGGFREAGPQPANAEVGELIELTRWNVKFTGCQIQPPTEFSEFGKVEILFEATNTWHASQYAIAQNSMRIVMPNGERFGVDDEFFSMVDRERSGNFEPGFTRPALIRAELTQPLWDDPDALVRLVLGRESQTDSFLSEGSWYASSTAAILEMPCQMVAQ